MRGLSSRSLRDAALVEHFREVHSEDYGVYGVRKMCRVLQRQGIDIGREQTARLMRSAGLSGKGQRAKVGHQSQRVSPKARIFALTW
ncbi:hypothetical protein CRD09_03070 [Corynebacterium sp. LK22]|nr:hypothetical protein [Corynebacterium sp. LK22]